MGDQFQLIFQVETKYKSIDPSESHCHPRRGYDQSCVHRWLVKVRLAQPSQRDYMKNVVQDIYLESWPFQKDMVDTRDNK